MLLNHTALGSLAESAQWEVLGNYLFLFTQALEADCVGQRR
jgi:hypothetical protein